MAEASIEVAAKPEAEPDLKAQLASVQAELERANKIIRSYESVEVMLKPTIEKVSRDLFPVLIREYIAKHLEASNGW